MLRIMSNNQWKNDPNRPYWEEKGLDCSAAVRERGFAKFYEEYLPDVVGLQEVSALMADELLRNLKNDGYRYALLWGRDTPILYRPDKLEVLDVDYLIYSKEVPGLVGEFNNSKTKSYCVAVFRVKETGKVFAFMTTHLWWKHDDPQSPYYFEGSGKARTYQMGIALDRLEEMARAYHAPAILVGDLNTFYYTDPIRLAKERGFSHAHDVAVEFANEEHGMHDCGPEILGPYTPLSFDRAIDHILVKNFSKEAVRRFERYSMPESYLVLSDHAPIWIELDY